MKAKDRKSPTGGQSVGNDGGRTRVDPARLELPHRGGQRRRPPLQRGGLPGRPRAPRPSRVADGRPPHDHGRTHGGEVRALSRGERGGEPAPRRGPDPTPLRAPRPPPAEAGGSRRGRARKRDHWCPSLLPREPGRRLPPLAGPPLPAVRRRGPPPPLRRARRDGPVPARSGPMKMRLLVDADEFRPTLASDLAAARSSVFVQALTFEADAAGRSVADLLAASPARDRRVLVDVFTRHVLSDRFRWRS